MSYDPSEYPAAWLQIAVRVKRAAGWLCEHCGREHDPGAGYCLTVHHLDGDKRNSCWTNLVALGQRCHLRLQASYRSGQMLLPGFRPARWLLVRGLVHGVPAGEAWLWSAVRAGAGRLCDACGSGEPVDPQLANANRVPKTPRRTLEAQLVYLDGDAANWSVWNVAALCQRCLRRRELTLPALFCEERGRAAAGGERKVLRESLRVIASGSFGTAGGPDPGTTRLQATGTLRERAVGDVGGYVWET